MHGDLHLSYCLLYLDDIIVYSRTYEEHLVRLEAVFHKLKEAGLKLSPSKCHFLCKEIKYLGHMISERGIGVDPEKVSCVQAWPVPKTVKDVQGFLGFTSFYRRFIRDFAKTAKPLHDATHGGEHCKLKTKTRIRYPPLKWGESQQEPLKSSRGSAVRHRFWDLLTMPNLLYYTQMQVATALVLCSPRNRMGRKGS